MNIYHHQNLQEAIDGMKKIFSICWSENLMRLAIAHVDDKRHVRISLYDELGEKKDSFPTKPANKNNKSYVVRTIEFSPDSLKLAVAQSDSIVFVYYLGSSWADKKTICNKFEQTSQVSCLSWPKKSNNKLYFGVAEGKIKVGNIRTNRAQVLYSTESYIVSLDSSLDNKYLISGHIDNSIYKYSLESNQLTKILQYPCIPYCLSYGQEIVVAGNNGKITFHETTNAEKKFEFDYSNSNYIRDFTCSKFNSSGDAVILGNFNRFLVFYKKKGEWVEVFNNQIDNLYSVTALCWKPDSSAFVTGNLCGSVDIFESCLKKTIFKNKFEISFLSESQIMIKNIETKERVNLNLTISTEVEKISVQKDNYSIVTTNKSILIGCVGLGLYSELNWVLSGNEFFDFSKENVCLIYVLDEINIVEFGEHAILGCFKSSFLQKDLVSVRIVKRENNNNSDNEINEGNNIIASNLKIKLLAYLIDRYTFNVVNLIDGNIIFTYTHFSELLSIEITNKGDKLIFKDKDNSLYLITIGLKFNSNNPSNYLFNNSGKRSLLLRNCSKYYLIKNTGIIVAIANKTLFVWYCYDDLNFYKKKLISSNNINVKDNSANEICIEEINEATNDSANLSDNNKDLNVIKESNTNSNVCFKIDNEIIEIYKNIELNNLKKAIQILETKDIYINNTTNSNQMRISRTNTFKDKDKDNKANNDPINTNTNTNSYSSRPNSGIVIPSFNNTNTNNMNFNNTDKNYYNNNCNNNLNLTNNSFNDKNNIKLNTNNRSEEYFALWRYLAEQAILTKQLYLASICYGHLDNIPKVKYLNQILTDIDKYGSAHPIVEAKIHLFNKDFLEAENILLKNNLIREAYDLFYEIKKYNTAYSIAERYKFNDLQQISDNYMTLLEETKDYDRMGDILVKRNQIKESISLLINHRCVVKASDIIINNKYKDFFNNNADQIAIIEQHLKANNLDNNLARFKELQGDLKEAYYYYNKEKNFSKCFEIANKLNDSILKQETENNWGEELYQRQEIELSLNHYIEANNTTKAVEVALKLKRINIVFELLTKIDTNEANNANIMQIIKELGDYYKSIKEYIKAELLYLISHSNKEIINMYCESTSFKSSINTTSNNLNIWSNYNEHSELKRVYLKLRKQEYINREIKENFNIADNINNRKLNQILYYNYSESSVNEFSNSINNKAQYYYDKNELKKAELLFLIIDEVDLAIQMYKNEKAYDKMIELVKKYHKNYLKETYDMIGDLVITDLKENLRKKKSDSIIINEQNISFNLEDNNDIVVFISKLASADSIIKEKILYSISNYYLSENYLKSAEIAVFFLSNINKALNFIYEFMETSEFLDLKNEYILVIVDLLGKFVTHYDRNKLVISSISSIDINVTSNNNKKIDNNFDDNTYLNIIIASLRDKKEFFILVSLLCKLKAYNIAYKEIKIIEQENLVNNDITKNVENNKHTNNSYNANIIESLSFLVLNNEGDNFKFNKEFDLAEEKYIEAKNYKQAIDMYLENEEFENALRIAKIYLDNHTVNHVLLSQAYSKVRQKDLEAAEKCFAAADDHFKMVEIYLSSNKKKKAIEYIKKYCPSKIDELSLFISKNSGSDDSFDNIPVKESNINPDFKGNSSSKNNLNKVNSKDNKDSKENENSNEYKIDNYNIDNNQLTFQNNNSEDNAIINRNKHNNNNNQLKNKNKSNDFNEVSRQQQDSSKLNSNLMPLYSNQESTDKHNNNNKNTSNDNTNTQQNQSNIKADPLKINTFNNLNNTLNKNKVNFLHNTHGLTIKDQPSFYTRSIHSLETLKRTKVQNSNNKNVKDLQDKFEYLYSNGFLVDSVEYLLLIQSIKQKNKSKNDNNNNNQETECITNLSSEEILQKALTITLTIKVTNNIEEKEKECLLEEIATRYLKLTHYTQASNVYIEIKQPKAFEKAILCLLKGKLFKEAHNQIENKIIQEYYLNFDKNEEYLVFKDKLTSVIQENKNNPLNINDLNQMIKNKEYISVMKLIQNFSNSKEIFDNYLIKICSVLFNQKQFFYLCEFLLTIEIEITDKLIEVINSLSFEILAEENLEELEILKFLYTKYWKQIENVLINKNNEQNYKDMLRLQEISHFQYYRYLIKFHIDNSKKDSNSQGKGDYNLETINNIKNMDDVYKSLCCSLLRYGDIIKFDVALYYSFIMCYNQVSVALINIIL